MQLVKASLRITLLMASYICLNSVAYSDDLEWHGFLSTGVSFTDSKVPYQGGINRKARVAEETFLGLNLSKDLNREWRLAGQILGRAGQADSTAKVDWAFVTYEPSADYKVLLGKQKIPIYLTSEFIDVGRAYPWVVPPEEVYSIFLTLKAFTGASAEYNFSIGDSVVTIAPYGGDVLYESAPNSPTAFTKVRGNNMFGLSLAWALGSTKLRASMNQATWDLSYGEERDFGERKLQLYSVGLKSEFDGYLIMAEYAGMVDRDEDHYLGLSKQLASKAQSSAADEQDSLLSRSVLLQQKIGGNRGYYATFGKEFLEDFLIHATYASVKRPYQPNNSRDQTSGALGINYDINSDSVLKFEGKYVKLPSNSQGLFTLKTTDDEAMIYRFGYSMIF